MESKGCIIFHCMHAALIVWMHAPARNERVDMEKIDVCESEIAVMMNGFSNASLVRTINKLEQVDITLLFHLSTLMDMFDCVVFSFSLSQTSSYIETKSGYNYNS